MTACQVLYLTANGEKKIVYAFCDRERGIAEDDQFAARVHEDVIAQLTKVKGINVIASRSTIEIAKQSDSLTEIAAHAYERNVPFLVLKDFGAEFADMLGVTRTPTICVMLVVQPATAESTFRVLM